MRSIRLLVTIAALLLLGVNALGQRRIVIPAGTPEDQELQAIANQSDAKQKITMLEEFANKYATNKPAAAYSNWQLAQQYAATGEQAKALAAGDKALAAMPDALDIIVSQADIAQQLKANDKVVDYATRGAAVYHAIPADSEGPEAMANYKQQYEYLEATGYNAIAGEQDAKKRMQEIDSYVPAFTNGRFTEQLTTLAVMTYQQMKDMAGLAAFADKIVAKNGSDMRLLTALSSAFVNDNPAKAGTYARKAIELQTKSENPETKSLAGVAHSVLGQSLVRESKFAAGVTELKTATSILKDSPQDEAAAYYFLGFAYAKLERGADAVAALTQAAKYDTPYKGPAEEMIGKIQAARKKK